MIGMTHNNGSAQLQDRMPNIPGIPPSLPDYQLQGPLGVPITPIHGFGPKRWKGYESLQGLGASDADLEAMAQQIAAGSASSDDIAELMRVMNKNEKATFSAKLIAAGVDPSTVASATHKVQFDGIVGRPVSKFWAIAGTVSMAASAYHGYKRNNSVGWALGWGLLGALFPIITPTIGIAQGFAKPKR